MSGGCRMCCRYGSEDQRMQSARHLIAQRAIVDAAKVWRYELDERDATHKLEDAIDALLRMEGNWK